MQLIVTLSRIRFIYDKYFRCMPRGAETPDPATLQVGVEAAPRRRRLGSFSRSWPASTTQPSHHSSAGHSPRREGTVSTRNSAHPRSRLLWRLHLNLGDRQGCPGILPSCTQSSRRSLGRPLRGTGPRRLQDGQDPAHTKPRCSLTHGFPQRLVLARPCGFLRTSQVAFRVLTGRCSLHKTHVFVWRQRRR